MKVGKVMDNNQNKLESIINNNKNIKLDNNIKNYLKILEKIIPEELRNNFYTNLGKVKIINNDYSIQETYFGTNNGATGKYIESSNTITILSSYIYKSAIQEGCDKNEAYKCIYQCLLHELIHMASSNYNEETGKTSSGFNNPSSLKNNGLTEGLIETISSAIVNPKYNINSGYNIERYIVNQLMTIIGQNPLIYSLFANKGTQLLEEKLNTITKETNLSYELFRHIETIHTQKTYITKTKELEKVQDILLFYLSQKITNLEQENKISEIENTLKTYSRWFITKDKLLKLGYDPNIYKNLEKNEEHFNEIINRNQEEQKHTR